MAIATPEVYQEMLTRAKDGKFAYPAVNVTSSQTLTAALQGFAEAGSDGIIQVSVGGAEYWSGSTVKDRVAGSLAMSLRKADALLAGSDFHIGLAEQPEQSKEPYFVPASRLEQAKRMLTEGRQAGIEFVLPADFVLTTGQVSETVGPGNAQMDVGPKTTELFSRKVGEFIGQHRSGANGAASGAFHNGGCGKFGDAPFERGAPRARPGPDQKSQSSPARTPPFRLSKSDRPSESGKTSTAPPRPPTG